VRLVDLVGVVVAATLEQAGKLWRQGREGDKDEFYFVICSIFGD